MIVDSRGKPQQPLLMQPSFAPVDPRETAIDVIRSVTGNDDHALQALGAVQGLKSTKNELSAAEILAFRNPLSVIYQAAGQTGAAAATAFGNLIEYAEGLKHSITPQEMWAFSEIAEATKSATPKAFKAITAIALKEGKALTPEKILSYKEPFALLAKPDSSALDLISTFVQQGCPLTSSHLSLYVDPCGQLGHATGKDSRYAFETLAQFAMLSSRALTPSEVLSYRESFAAITEATAESVQGAYGLLAKFAKQLNRALTPAEVLSYKEPFRAICTAITSSNFTCPGRAFDTLIEFAIIQNRAFTPEEITLYSAPFGAIAGAVGNLGFTAFHALSQFAQQDKVILTPEAISSYLPSFTELARITDNERMSAFQSLGSLAHLRGVSLSPADITEMTDQFGKDRPFHKPPAIYPLWHALEEHLERHHKNLSLTFMDKFRAVAAIIDQATKETKEFSAVLPRLSFAAS